MRFYTDFCFTSQIVFLLSLATKFIAANKKKERKKFFRCLECSKRQRAWLPNPNAEFHRNSDKQHPRNKRVQIQGEPSYNRAKLSPRHHKFAPF